MLNHDALNQSADGEILPYDLLSAVRRRRDNLVDIPAPTGIQASALAALILGKE